MNGYGSHTFKLVNKNGDYHYCKFHYKTDQGVRNLPASTADELAGTDPDYAIRDLYNAIANDDFPSWTFYIQVPYLNPFFSIIINRRTQQVMTPEQAAKAHYNPFDLTKTWSHKEYPLIPVGKMVLNRNPVNYFAEVEQIAFNPAHMVPGIEPSPDRMLQGSFEFH